MRVAAANYLSGGGRQAKFCSLISRVWDVVAELAVGGWHRLNRRGSGGEGCLLPFLYSVLSFISLGHTIVLSFSPAHLCRDIEHARAS